MFQIMMLRYDLKHVKMNDKSAPIIPNDVHIAKMKTLIE